MTAMTTCEALRFLLILDAFPEQPRNWSTTFITILGLFLRMKQGDSQ
jgi:hypothetical protein